MTRDAPEDSSRSPLAAAVGPRTGLVVGGRYRLVAPLAEGGMGSVWRAEHQTLRHAVAVKFLSGGSVQNPVLRARFEREARVAAQIAEDSKHVVKTTDHGVAEDGTPWIVMELLHGEGLDLVLRREGKLSLERASKIVRHIARGLEVVHRHGVVHRDLKPGNVFLCRDLDVEHRADVDLAAGEHEEAKLFDFGVAKSVWDDDAPTREGTVLGTPGYMSPEQLSGDALVDLRTDVWALGAVAYRMLTGRTPFGVGTTAEIGARIKASEPTPPSRLVPELPPEIDAVIARALAKDTEQRYRTARELADAFSKAAGLALPSGEAPLSTNDGAVVEAPPAESAIAQKPAPARPRRAVAAGAAIVLALLSLLFVVVRSTRSRSPNPRSAAENPSHPSAAPSAVASPIPTSPPLASVASPSDSVSDASVSPAPSESASAASAGSAQKPGKKVPDTWNKKDEM
jgi:serine/threonine protein kinase